MYDPLPIGKIIVMQNDQVITSMKSLLSTLLHPFVSWVHHLEYHSHDLIMAGGNLCRKKKVTTKVFNPGSCNEPKKIIAKFVRGDKWDEFYRARKQLTNKTTKKLNLARFSASPCNPHSLNNLITNLLFYFFFLGLFRRKSKSKTNPKQVFLH